MGAGEVPDPVTIHLNAPHGHRIPRRLLERALRTLLAEEGRDVAELSVTFLPDAALRELNRRYLDRDGVTDVLAFSLHDEDETPVGDVYVGVEQAERQAEDHGVSRTEELVRLALHGALHVLGYDHPDAAEERKGSEQYRRQEEVLRKVMASEPPPGGERNP